MINTIRRIVSVLLLFLCFEIAGQNKKIDSLANLIKTAKSDTAKLFYKNLIGEECFNFNPDTALKIWKNIESEINSKIKPANKDDEKSIRRTLAEAINSIGAYYYVTGNSNKALEEWKRSIAIREELKDEYGIALSYVNIGFFYYNKRDLYTAIDYWQKSLAIADKINNSMLQTSALNCLGGLYSDINDDDKALETYSKLLEIKNMTKDEYGLESIHLNLATIYNDIKKNKEAWYHIKKSLYYSNKNNSVETIAGALRLEGQLYKNQGDLDSALYISKQGYEIASKNNFLQVRGLVSGNLSSIYLAQKDYRNALLYAKESYDVAEQLQAPFEKSEACLQLSLVYEIAGNSTLALSFLRKHISLKENIAKENKDSELLKKQLTFDHERDKITIQKEQEKKDAIAKEEKQKQQIVLIAVIIVLVLTTGLLFFIYRGFTQKKKANIELEEKNKLILLQKTILEEHQKEILESMRYAKRIQLSLMPTEKYIAKNLNK